MWKNLLVMACVWLASVSDGVNLSADAGVEGNAFDVVVISSTDGLEDQLFRFLEGGEFETLAGVVGTWDEIDLVILTVWEAEFTDDGATIQYRGLQFFSVLFGTGMSDSGLTYVAFGGASQTE